ncbi:DUF6099 family protein [Kitasatospora sp. NBC_01560]|uniref:DUF6099 family protein n=1 Tax=Kitasatospora sp. NBC_01560 TaxID=2975965 RepID=UPI003868DB86
MEALRLIKTARHALAEARNVPDVLAEARQAALLTEAVGARLAELDDGEPAGLGQQLAEAGSHAAGCLDHAAEESSALSGLGSGGRAGRLTELGPPAPMLAGLGALLRDVGETLVVLACGADTESLYWTCIDGVDAAADCRDLVTRLAEAVQRAAGEPGRGPAEPAAAGPPAPAQVSEEERAVLVIGLGPPSGRSEARGPGDCSAARSADTEASSSCICSSRVFGRVGTADVSAVGCCGRADASGQGSDMGGPLRIGSAV